jgi:hypothetical protein
VFGPLDIQPLSSHIYGLYTGLVYLTPVLGGYLADRVFGQRRTVVIGASLMADRSFHDGVRAAVSARRSSFSSSATARSSPTSRPRSARFMRRATTAATAPSRSSMSASTSARSWRRSSAARLARRSAGTTASARPASA